MPFMALIGVLNRLFNYFMNEVFKKIGLLLSGLLMVGIAFAETSSPRASEQIPKTRTFSHPTPIQLSTGTGGNKMPVQATSNKYMQSTVAARRQNMTLKHFEKRLHLDSASADDEEITPVQLGNKSYLPALAIELEQAQNQAEVLPIVVRKGFPSSLDEAIRTAMRLHPDALAAKSEVLSAKANVSANSFGWYPTLQINSSAGQATQFGAGNRSLNLTLQQRLWDAGRVDASIDYSKALESSSIAQEGQTLDTLGSRVSAAYIGVMRAREQYAIAKQNVNDHRELFTIIDRRKQGGLGTSSDVSLAVSRLQQAKATEALWNSEIGRAEASYFSVVNQKPPQEIDDLELWEIDGGLKTVLDATKAHSPQLQKLYHDMTAAEANVKAQKAELYPTLFGRVDYIDYLGGQTNSAYFNDTRAYFYVQWQNDVALSQRFRVEGAEQKVASARQAVQSGERQLIESVTGLWQDLVAAKDRLKELKKFEISAIQTLGMFKHQFSIGRRSWPEVMNALQDLYASRNQLADAKYQMTTARLRIAFVAGELENYTEAVVSTKTPTSP